MVRIACTRAASRVLVIVAAFGSAVSAAPQFEAPARSSAVISIPAEGLYRFGSEKVERRELPQRLYDALHDAPAEAQVVELIAGEDVRYVVVRDALCIIRELGFDSVRLEVLRADAADPDALLEARIVSCPVGVRAESSGLPPPTYPERASDDPPPLPLPPPPPKAPPRTVAEAQPVPEVMDPSTLFVDVRAASGSQTIAVNSRAVQPSQLRTFLQGFIADRPHDDRHVALKASREIAFGEVAGVMADIEAAGASVIWLVVDDIEGPTEIAPVLPHPPSEAGGIPGGVKGLETAPLPPNIVRVSGGVLRGKAIRKPQPSYPGMAKAAGVEGAVAVEVTVDESGTVYSARAISGHPLLRDAAVTAARGWTFKPTLRQGKRVMVIGTITFDFRAPQRPPQD